MSRPAAKRTGAAAAALIADCARRPRAVARPYSIRHGHYGAGVDGLPVSPLACGHGIRHSPSLRLLSRR